MKLSVVIPIYNMEKFMKKCVDSVIYPQLGDYEIILVNDGSSDSSLEICRDYESRYPKLIKVMDKENGGLGSARNAGMEVACGEYVLFIDSDDSLAENALPEMMERLDEGFDLMVFDFISVSEAGRQLSYTKGCPGEEGLFKLEDRPGILVCPPSAWNKVWRRSLFLENGVSYPPRLWFEDLFTSPKLYLAAEKMLYVPKAWYEYLIRDGSITNSKNPKRNMEILVALDENFNYFKEKGRFEQFREHLVYMSLYHRLVTISRINMADWRSPLQKELYEGFVKEYPDYESNPNIRTMPGKYKLLLFFVKHGLFGCYNLIMSANNFIKGKS